MTRQRWITGTAVLALVAAALVPADMAAAQAAARHVNKAPAVQKVPSVPGHAATTATLPAPSPASRNGSAATPNWPAAGSATVALASPAANKADAVAAPAHVRAGTLPVSVASTRALTGSAKLSVTVLAHSTAVNAGLAGMLFRLQRVDSASSMAATVSVDYSSFAGAYGGDWASRLRIVALPACAATTPQVVSCRTGTILRSDNDMAARTVSAPVTASSAVSLLAVAAAPSGSAGSYSASTLADAGTWQVATQGGSFSWSYPMAAPSLPGGLTPDFAAQYSSASVDGQTAATNNQPSWVGLGWDVGVGSIQRGYESCVDANPSTPADQTGDECWGTDNATMSLNGQSTPLVKVSNSVWHPANDNGETIEHKTGGVNGDDNGEYWIVTTTDGTKYYFGLNRLPGWAGTDPTTQSVYTVPVFGNDPENPRTGLAFADTVEQQAYQWNLDYVVDPHGDAIAYYYTPETNKYGELLGKTTVTYTRGGTLARADYGFRDGAAYSAPAPAQVVFGTANRCVASDCSVHTAAAWPDVPWDQECADTATSCGTHFSPSFWTTQRLSTVTTQLRNGTGYTPVDRWTLTQTFPDPGDGTGDAMWLQSIQHTGLIGGSASLPPVTFGGKTFPNRVNTAGDGLPPMDKFRIITVTNESGGVLTVNYDLADCSATALPTPDANTTRCFPQIWTPAGDAKPITDWFVKYVVGDTEQQDLVGGNPTQSVFYTYPVGGGAWHYTDNPLIPAARRTWSTWRGFGTVHVITGDPKDPTAPQSEITYTYFRGMNGDHLANGTTRSASVTDSQGTVHTDADQLAGFQLEAVTTDDVGGPMVTDEITTPWQNGPTATQGSLSAFMVEAGDDVTRTALSAGGVRTTEIDTTFNTHDEPIQVADRGDITTTADDRCTTTTYAASTTPNLVDLPAEVATVGATCGTTPTFPGAAISDERKTFNAAGDALTTAEVTSYTGTTPQFVTTDTSTYDAYGRVLNSTDARGTTTVTGYGAITAATIAPTVETDVTDALGAVTKTVTSMANGQPVKTTDPAGNASTLTYDPLGRLAQVWLPDRPTTDTPSQTFAYSMTNNRASYQSASAIDANGNYQTSYTIFDGFLRQRQTQAPSHGSNGTVARDITDTFYNSQGAIAQQNPVYFNASAPSGTLQVTDPTLVPMENATRFDGAQRPILQTSIEYNQVATDAAGNKLQTVTAYGGDHTDVTPPVGSTPTTTYTDARGQTTEIREYHGTTATGAYDSTRYTYTPAGKSASIVDAAGDTWTYGYDVRGRQISASDPDKGTSSISYDADGNVTSTTDARGQTLSYTYDVLNRKTAENNGSTLLASWTYDPVLGFTTSANSFVNGNEYTLATTAVDAVGRPTIQKVTIPAAEKGLAGTYTTTTGYTPDGNPATVALPAIGNLAAETLTYSYDNLGSPTEMKGAAFYVTTTSYVQNDEIAAMQLGPDASAIFQNFTHDIPTNRLTASSVETLTSAGAVDTEQYGYDLSGNVTSETDTMPSQSVDRQCFSYDYLHRLSQAWTSTAACGVAGTSIGGPAPYWQSYSYDLLGDRTQEVQHATVAGGSDTTTAYHYSAPGHAQAVSGLTVTGPSGTTTQSYAYDAAGNTTSRPAPDGGTETLSWNPDGLTSQVSEGTTNTSYVYDADGNRLIAHEASGATLYLGSGELHVNVLGTGATGTRYYAFGGQTVAVRVGTALTYLAGDEHNTSDLEINPSTLAVTKRRLDPFGNARSGPVFPGDRGFIGGVKDVATGLTHLGARDYDPVLGRFLSVDPMLAPDNPASLNPYVYSQDNPATMSDPTGDFGSPGGGCINGDCRIYRPGPGQPLHFPPPPAKPKKPTTRRLPTGDADGDINLRFPYQKQARRPTSAKELAKQVKAVISDFHKAGAFARATAGAVQTLLRENYGIGSISVCSEISATAILNTSSTGTCFSFDLIGVAGSHFTSEGHAWGLDAHVSLKVELSSEPADEVNEGTSSSISTGAEVELGPGADYDVSLEHGNGEWNHSTAFGLSAGIGASFSFLSSETTDGENDGYIHRW